jgi:hypothetical protein
VLAEFAGYGNAFAVGQQRTVIGALRPAHMPLRSAAQRHSAGQTRLRERMELYERAQETVVGVEQFGGLGFDAALIGPRHVKDRWTADYSGGALAVCCRRA